jgi:site-specific recombinase XerD
MSRLSRWLEEQSLDLGALATEQVDAFFASRREAGYCIHLTPESIVPLAGYLRRTGVLAERQPVVATGPQEVLLADFASFLLRERGLVEGTVSFYVHVARLFTSERLGPDGLRLEGLQAAEVTSFVARCCEHRSLSSSRQVVSALRSLLRFLALEDLTGLNLEQAVLSVSGSAASLPRAISAAQVSALLESCDRSTPIGLRDYAILMLLARLGLRDGEVVRLELGDVNWRGGDILVRGKGRRHDRLPLPSDVGEALADYLQRGRPAADSRKLFLRCYAPIRGLDAGSGVIRGVLARACKRAGMAYVCPHRLRHTAATEMLAAGAPLSEIGEVLRHRQARTTAIYARVDTDAMRSLARPWPGSAR